MAKGRSSIMQKAANPGKKHDKAILRCSVSNCTTEFYISEPGYPAKRYCSVHYYEKISGVSKKRQSPQVQMLRQLGLI